VKKRLIIIILIISVIGYGFIFYNKTSDPIDPNVDIDKIILIKHKRELQLVSENEIIKTYEVSLGREPIGKKEFEGDKKTPEGIYKIEDKNPNSGYYKNLGISYPNKNDINNAKSIGKPPGSLIKIHGLRNGLGWIGRFHLFFDWTMGCVAMTNDEVEELYNNVKTGTVIEIRE
jgi:murein L,D-transpeptidase YafK